MSVSVLLSDFLICVRMAQWLYDVKCCSVLKQRKSEIGPKQVTCVAALQCGVWTWPDIGLHGHKQIATTTTYCSP